MSLEIKDSGFGSKFISFMKYFPVILFLLISSRSYSQDSTDSSKSGYTLFEPTPKDLMRKFETDRPDYTESAITVDAGHFQFETDLFKTERTNIDGIKTINNYYNAANLKLGITNTLDIQFVISTFSTSAIKQAGNFEKESSGLGSLTIRAKQNLWGNDKGKTAFAILPFVNVPVMPGDKFSGGIVFPLAISLANGWELGTQIETDLINNEPGNGYHIDFLVSATTSHSISKRFDFFIEGVALRNNGLRVYEYFLDAGLIYNLAKNINFDAGFYYGIKNISSKTYFVGMSFRI